MLKIVLEDGREFDIEPTSNKLLNTEAMAIEKVTGWDFNEFEQKLQANSVMAMTAFIWVMCKRQEPTLRFTEVVFDFSILAEAFAAEEAKEADEAGQLAEQAGPTEGATSP